MADMTIGDLPSADLRSYAETGGGRIQAQISSFRDGLRFYDGINIIRVRGKQSRLLIMEDYLPVIGEIDGEIDLIGKGFFHNLKDLHGFFNHAHNVFFLLLKDSGGGDPGKDAGKGADEGEPVEGEPAEAEPTEAEPAEGASVDG
ncbi:MAG: hypothetical protein LBL63_05865 [Clostridiales Family XIII bacterium]|jgi:hypothetical protein|nr:hypothetical protein [Clostridiales Family XIII bacterium]